MVAIAVLTAGYQLFQAANNTAVMADVSPQQRGVMSGMLILSRNLGLVTGASVMGAVFAFAADSSDIRTAGPAALATGMQATFGVAALLAGAAIAIGFASRRRTGTVRQWAAPWMKRGHEKAPPENRRGLFG